MRNKHVQNPSQVVRLSSGLGARGDVRQRQLPGVEWFEWFDWTGCAFPDHSDVLNSLMLAHLDTRPPRISSKMMTTSLPRWKKCHKIKFQTFQSAKEFDLPIPLDVSTEHIHVPYCTVNHTCTCMCSWGDWCTKSLKLWKINSSNPGSFDEFHKVLVHVGVPNINRYSSQALRVAFNVLSFSSEAWISRAWRLGS